jgi:hypothetical protein
MSLSRITPIAIPLLGLWSLLGLGVQAHADDQDSVVQIVAGGITNFHEVDSGKLYRGALPEDSGLKLLAQAGIRTVIDLQGGDRVLGIPLEDGESAEDIADERESAAADQLGFISEPLSSMSLDDDIRSIDRIVLEMAEPRNQPVYVHCRHGSDRTGLLVALYRVYYQQCTPEQAHREMLADGHSQLPLFTWMDSYFYAKVQGDPRTHLTESSECPLPSAN